MSSFGSSGLAVVSGGTGLYLRPRSSISTFRRPPIRRSGAFGEVYDRIRTPPTPDSSSSIRPPQRRCTATTVGVSYARSSSPRSAPRSLPARSLWSTETRRPTLVVGLDVPPDRARARIAARTDAMFARGVVDEVR